MKDRRIAGAALTQSLFIGLWALVSLGYDLLNLRYRVSEQWVYFLYLVLDMGFMACQYMVFNRLQARFDPTNRKQGKSIAPWVLGATVSWLLARWIVPVLGIILHPETFSPFFTQLDYLMQSTIPMTLATLFIPLFMLNVPGKKTPAPHMLLLTAVLAFGGMAYQGFALVKYMLDVNGYTTYVAMYGQWPSVLLANINLFGLVVSFFYGLLCVFLINAVRTPAAASAPSTYKGQPGKAEKAPKPVKTAEKSASPSKPVLDIDAPANSAKAAGQVNEGKPKKPISDLDDDT